jgi:hypothetical protein
MSVLSVHRAGMVVTALCLPCLAAAQLPPGGRTVRTGTLTISRPAGPAPASLLVGATARGARLTWQAVASAAVYRVYRSTDPAIQGPELTSTPLGPLEYVDGTASPGATYYYRVAADYQDGRLGTAGPVAFTPAAPATSTLGTSTLSGPLMGGTAVRTPVSMPTNLTGAATPTSVALSWSSPAGAQWFEVARTNPAGVRTVITPQAFGGLRLTDAGLDPGAGYRYEVTAIGMAGDRATAQTTVTTTLPTNPGGLAASITLHNVQAQITPTLNVLSTASGDVTLNWNPVAGAASYEVSGPGLSLPRTVTGPPFTIPTVAPGPVTYSVVANFFNSVNRRFADLAKPSKLTVRIGSEPVDASPTDQDGGVMQWANRHGASDIHLFIGFRPEGPYTDIARGDPAFPYEIRDPERRPGRTVWYKVLSIFPSAPVAWTAPIQATRFGDINLTGLTATVRPGSILLSWDPNAWAWYHVLRWTGTNTAFEDMGIIPAASWLSSFFQDTKLSAGTRYKYSVCATSNVTVNQVSACALIDAVAQ